MREFRLGLLYSIRNVSLNLELARLFRCALTARADKGKGGPSLVFGEDADGNLVHIDRAERGKKCNLTCPDCHSALQARKGSQNTFHFAHISVAECETAGETPLHKLAKEVIEETGKLFLPPAILRTLQGNRVIHRARQMKFDRVEVEPFQQGFRPDVIGIKDFIENGEKASRRLIIEIHVTHKVDEIKKERLIANGESAIEIHLCDVDRNATDQEVADLLLGGAPREWIYHRDVTPEQMVIDKERERLAQEAEKKWLLKQAKEEEYRREQARLRAEEARRKEEEARKREAEKLARAQLREAEAKQRAAEQAEQENERREQAKKIQKDIERRKEERRLEAEKQDIIGQESDQRHEIAKAVPPKGADVAILANAMDERKYWRDLGFGALFEAGESDAYFDVEPIVWKTTLLKPLAPWNADGEEWVAKNEAKDLYFSFEAKVKHDGWLKEYFTAADLQRYDWNLHNFRPWHPAIDAAKVFLRAVNATLNLRTRDPSLSTMRREISHYQSSTDRFCVAAADLASTLLEKGIELLLAGKPATTPDGIKSNLRAFKTFSERERICFKHALMDSMADEFRDNLWHDDLPYKKGALANAGFTIRREGDQDTGSDGRAWRYLHKLQKDAEEHRISSLQADMGADLREKVEEITQMYLAMDQRYPSMRESLRECDLEFLFLPDDLVERLVREQQPQTAYDVYRITYAALGEIRRFREFGMDLGRLGKLCDGIENHFISRGIMYVGCQIAHERLEANHDVFLPGLETDDHLRALIRHVEMLCQKEADPAYGDRFATRALEGYPEEDVELIELMLVGNVSAYTKAIREIETRPTPPAWTYPPEKD